MDPRFKNKFVADTIWERVRVAAVASISKVPEGGRGIDHDKQDNSTEEVLRKKVKKSAIAVLFEIEDNTLQRNVSPNSTGLLVCERVNRELHFYKDMPLIPSYEDPTLWWWEKREAFPILYNLSTMYVCVRGSSTPSERVFSTAGDTLSQERSRFLPEKADMLVFLQKNC